MVTAKKLKHSKPDRRSSAAVKARRGKKGTTKGSATLRSASLRATQAAVRRVLEPQDLQTGKSETSSEDRAYRKAIDFLLSQTDYERMRVVRYNTTTFNLDRMRLLLKHLGDPHTKFKSVHVAGTKGKGSTCYMLAAMLQSCGYKVGLYTSPHLVDMRERIQIDGNMISPNEMTHWVKRVENAIGKMGSDWVVQGSPFCCDWPRLVPLINGAGGVRFGRAGCVFGRWPFGRLRGPSG